MNLIISFSGRANGNCDRIGNFIAHENDRSVRFRELNVHPCKDCEYECFDGECRYRSDDIYPLLSDMSRCDRIVLIVPMYCGNPSSLYFVFSERCQDYFMHNDTYDEIIRKLYIIGVYGNNKASPDFIPCLEKWFEHSPHRDRVLGIERHLYGQKLNDSIIDIEEVRLRISSFLKNRPSKMANFAASERNICLA